MPKEYKDGKATKMGEYGPNMINTKSIHGGRNSIRERNVKRQSGGTRVKMHNPY